MAEASGIRDGMRIDRDVPIVMDDGLTLRAGAVRAGRARPGNFEGFVRAASGPLAARLFVSSTTEDADVFAVFRVFTPDLREVVFRGAIDPHTPAGRRRCTSGRSTSHT
jgi:hypothetical protein